MRKPLLVSFFVLAGALTASAQSPTFYFSQIADGQQGGGLFWRTTIFLTNPSSGGGTVTGTITFYNSSRQPFNLSFISESNQTVGGGNTLDFQIPPLQTRKFVSTATSGLRSGFAGVAATSPISGTAVFSLYGPNGLMSEASVPGVSTPSTQQAIVVDTTGGFDTGVAVAYADTNAPPFHLRLLDTAGVEVVPSADRSVGFQLVGYVAGDFFPGARRTVGTLQVSSDAPFAALGLRFEQRSGIFTTIPPVNVASLIQPTLKWFERNAWLSPFSSLARLWAGVQVRFG